MKSVCSLALWLLWVILKSTWSKILRSHILKSDPEVISWSHPKVIPKSSWFILNHPEVILKSSWSHPEVILKSYPEVISWSHILKSNPEVRSWSHILKSSQSHPYKCSEVRIIRLPYNAWFCFKESVRLLYHWILGWQLPLQGSRSHSEQTDYQGFFKACKFKG